jgi:hypothetical protein
MFGWLRMASNMKFVKPAKFRVIPNHTFISGLEPTLEDLPHDKEVAVNYTDNVIFMNIRGQIVRFLPERSRTKPAEVVSIKK